MLSFSNGDFSLIPSSALPNHCSGSTNLDNPAANIMKPICTKKFDVRWRPGTKNVCNIAAYVCNFTLCYNCRPLASHNPNFNIDVQHIDMLSCGKPCSDPGFHSHENGYCLWPKCLWSGILVVVIILV